MNQELLKQNLNEIKRLTDSCLNALGRTKDQITTTAKLKPSSKSKSPEIDFELPIRPFIKQNAKKMSGPKKFTLLVAYLAKGDINKQVLLSEIAKEWNRMTAKHLLGLKFNRYFTSEAKDHDWVETKKKGFYNLRSSWKAIFT